MLTDTNSPVANPANPASSTPTDSGVELITIGTPETGIITNVPKIEVKSEDPNVWKWNESMTGQGERPTWLDTKYKNVEEQAKANVESQRYIGHLKQQLGAFSEGIPENYDFSAVQDDKFKFDTSTNEYSKFVTYLRENKIPQSIASKMVEFHKEIVSKNHVDVNEEIKKLGADGTDQLKSLKGWVESNFSKPVQEWLKTNTKTASDISALKEFRASMVQSPIPTTMSTMAVQQTKESLLKEYAENLYKGKKIADNYELQQEYIKRLKEFG